jgi:hypothetical protein
VIRRTPPWPTNPRRQLLTASHAQHSRPHKFRDSFRDNSQIRVTAVTNSVTKRPLGFEERFRRIRVQAHRPFRHARLDKLRRPFERLCDDDVGVLAGGVHVSNEDEDLALLRLWQRELRQQEADDIPQVLLHERDQVTEQVRADTAKTDALRTLGYNRLEREGLARSKSRRCKELGSQHKETAIKQCRWYLNQRVDWDATSLDPNYVAETWARLTKYRIDDAIKLWDKGFDPLAIDQITGFVAYGGTVQDLTFQLHGRTVLEHLHDGQSAEWCIDSIRWARRSR